MKLVKRAKGLGTATGLATVKYRGEREEEERKTEIERQREGGRDKVREPCPSRVVVLSNYFYVTFINESMHSITTKLYPHVLSPSPLGVPETTADW